MIPRRLLDTTIERLRAAGGRNEFGEYVTETTTTELPAHVQPVRLEDRAEVGGQQLSERLLVWLAGADQLLAAQADGLADRVRIATVEYEVIETESWTHRRRSYTRALCLRES